MLFPIITIPYVSRILGVDNIGLVNFVFNYVNYFGIIATLGINYYGVRAIAKCRGDRDQINKVFSEIFKLLWISTSIISIVYCCTIFIVPEFCQFWYIYLLVGINLFLTPFSIDWYFQAMEDFKMITIRSLIIKILSFVGLFIFVRQKEDIIPYLLLWLFSSVVSNIWNMTYAIKKGLIIKWFNVKVMSHIKPMLIFCASNISTALFTAVNVLMLGFLCNYQQVGLYSSPLSVSKTLLGIVLVVNLAVFPRLAANAQNKDRNYNSLLLQKTLDLQILLIVPIAIGLCLCSAVFIPWFFGTEFLGSILPMKIVVFACFLSLMNNFLISNVLMVYGFELKVLYVFLITAAVSVLLNFILMPVFGAIGASTTVVIAEFVEILLNLFLIHKFTLIRFSPKQTGLAVLCCLPFFPVYFICNRLNIANPVVFLITFVGCCALIYFILQRYILKNQMIIQMRDMLLNKIKK
jgi:O-antigen/teichoic acid export membrane protein